MEQEIKLDLPDRISGWLFVVSIISIATEIIMLDYHNLAVIYAFYIAFISAFLVVSIHQRQEHKRRRTGLPPITGKDFLLPIAIPMAIMIAAPIMFFSVL